MPTLSSLESVLQEVKKEIVERNKIREETHENMRKATSLSKQAILLIHQKKYADAEKFIKEAETKISSLQELSKQFPEIVFGGMFSAALQEYSEARIFLVLVKGVSFYHSS